MNPPTPDGGVVRCDLGREKKLRLITKSMQEGRSLTQIIQELVDEYLDRPTRPNIAIPGRMYRQIKGKKTYENQTYL